MVFLWVVLWFVKKKTSSGQVGMQDMRVRVVARQTLSPKASVSIVEIGDTTVVLGVTDHTVTHLGTISGAAVPMGAPTSQARVAPANGTVQNQVANVSAGANSVGPLSATDANGELPADLSVQSYIKSLLKRG